MHESRPLDRTPRLTEEIHCSLDSVTDFLFNLTVTFPLPLHIRSVSLSCTIPGHRHPRIDLGYRVVLQSSSYVSLPLTSRPQSRVTYNVRLPSETMSVAPRRLPQISPPTTPCLPIVLE